MFQNSDIASHVSCGLVVAGLDSSACMSVSARAVLPSDGHEGESCGGIFKLRRMWIPLPWLVGCKGCVFVAAWTAAFPHGGIGADVVIYSYESFWHSNFIRLEFVEFASL